MRRSLEALGTLRTSATAPATALLRMGPAVCVCSVSPLGHKIAPVLLQVRTPVRIHVPGSAVRCGHVNGPNQGPDSSPTALRIAGRTTRTLPSTTGAPQTPISITRAPSPARQPYEVA